MTVPGTIAVLIAFLLLGVFVLLYFDAFRRLRRFRHIEDVELYRSNCEKQAQAAVEQHRNLATQSLALQQHLAEQKKRAGQYQQLLGNLKTAAELHEKVENDKQRVKQLSEMLRTLDATADIAAQATYYQNYLAQLKHDVEAVEETRDLQEFGFYRPHYDFQTSDLFSRQLERTRQVQKTMLKARTACVCNTDWSIDGNKSEGKKMIAKQIKLMLRAFNGECDAAVGKLRYNNIVSLESRVKRSFEQINKLGESNHAYLAGEYFNLKIEELRLAHELELKKQQEKEKERQIRDQMREEQKVAAEIEKAVESADREEHIKSQALEQARAELAQRGGEQTSKLEALVTRLETELKGALERKAKAIARAQLTKSGHVYILSNVGSFGEGVFKIGMSRRLEPLQRVDELGSAGVPFPFDVHAMIYSESAPDLECALHRHFAHRRVNLVNLRREFFRVLLDEIRAAVAQHFGQVTFVLVPEAEQYRQTVAKLKDVAHQPMQLQIA